MGRGLLVGISTLAVALVVTACGASVTSPASGNPSAAPAETAAGASAVPGASTTPDATEAPAESGTPATTEGPTDTLPPDVTEPPAESLPPATAAPDGGGSPAPASTECSGTAENRDFFAAAAESMPWDVYCAVLPDGWHVDAGSYRLADGGRLDVTYRGPDGSRVELQEGAYCTAGASACSPHDDELGPASFGDRSGMLVTLGPNVADGFAIYVDPGAAPSWAITGVGMDQATFTAIAAALLRVAR